MKQMSILGQMLEPRQELQEGSLSHFGYDRFCNLDIVRLCKKKYIYLSDNTLNRDLTGVDVGDWFPSSYCCQERV